VRCLKRRRKPETSTTSALSAHWNPNVGRNQHVPTQDTLRDTKKDVLYGLLNDVQKYAENYHANRHDLHPGCVDYLCHDSS